MSSTLRIAEIFTSIQGEGSWVGMPSIFVRISGCNLRCVWCDTRYASWEPEGPIRQVEEIVSELAENPVRHVVITGGEPMLFDAIEPLTARLREFGKTITIETAGTIYRELECDLMSLSPKLKHSTPPADTPGGWHGRHESLRLQVPVIRQLLHAYRCQLKFVVGANAKEDVAEIEALLDQLPPVDPSDVILMAEGVTSEAQVSGQRSLVQTCLEHGWRLTPRMHIDLFGNTKGT